MVRSPLIHRRTWLAALCALIFALAWAPWASARAPKRQKNAEEATLGKLVNNVRYGLDVTALGLLDADGQARALLGPAYEGASASDRAEFTRLFQHVFAGVAFPKMRDSFRHLTSITYDPAQPEGSALKVGSVLHLQVGPKEQEIKAVYLLSKASTGEVKVVDVTIVGDKSMLTNIRADQVAPILAEGGMPKLLSLLRARAAELPAPKDAPLTAKP